MGKYIPKANRETITGRYDGMVMFTRLRELAGPLASIRAELVKAQDKQRREIGKRDYKAAYENMLENAVALDNIILEIEELVDGQIYGVWKGTIDANKRRGLYDSPVVSGQHASALVNWYTRVYILISGIASIIQGKGE